MSRAQFFYNDYIADIVSDKTQFKQSNLIICRVILILIECSSAENDEKLRIHEPVFFPLYLSKAERNGYEIDSKSKAIFARVVFNFFLKSRSAVSIYKNSIVCTMLHCIMNECV